MQCMGPSASHSKKLANDLVDKLWPELEEAYHKDRTVFSLVSDVEKFLRELMDLVGHHGYNYQSYELDRHKYLTVGVLQTMFPDEKYYTQYNGFSAEGRRLSHTKFEETSKAKLAELLSSTFFLLDCEDF